MPDSPDSFAPLALTYDDVLLLPAPSDVIPSEVDTSTRLTRRITLSTPLVQAYGQFSNRWILKQVSNRKLDLQPASNP